MTRTIIVLIFISIALSLAPTMIPACSRMLCAPTISRCQLEKVCRCETSLNYTCRKTCSQCLGDLFPDCCSCVNLCPNDDDHDKSLESHVKLFDRPNEQLFDLLTEEGDPSERWHVQTIPATNSIDCTTVYIGSCLDMYKCESSCLSLGASGYRWFHIGCCECTGKYCFNFGVNQIRCRYCPEESDRVIDSDDIF